MKKALPFLIFFVFFCCGSSFADPPSEIAGFGMGADISTYKDRILPETALPLRHSEYLTEVDLKPPDGFKSGYLTYGNCDQAGRIVKIKLKYDRDDKQFFDELLERFDKKFGKPTEYQGDAFRACIAWKWAFTVGGNERLSLILAYNCEEDEEGEGGNSVRLISRSAVEKERACFRAKQPVPSADAKEEKNKKKPDFKLLIPQ